MRDRLIERWKDTELFFDKGHTKRVYYLSLEFLMGRSLTNALSNLHLDESFSRALRDLGIKMEELSEAVPTLPCPALLALPCPALPRPVLPCPALPCPALPCLTLSCLALACPVAHASFPAC